MKKNALIIVSDQEQNGQPLERALLDQGFIVVRAAGHSEAIRHLDHEIFSTVILLGLGAPAEREKLIRAFTSRPFPMITPIIQLGPASMQPDRVLISSLLDQYFPLETEPELVAEFASETYELRREKAKRGRLGVLTVPEVVFEASKFFLTGAVVVENDREKCIVYLDDGHVSFASSNRDENRFGEFLVQRGIIDRQQHRKAELVLQRTGKRFGQVLVDEGIIKPQILKTLIQSQVKHIVFNVFDWREGEFYVLFDETTQDQDSLAKFEVSPMILEGVRFKLKEDYLEKEFAPFTGKVNLLKSVQEIQRECDFDKHDLSFLKKISLGTRVEDLIHSPDFSRLDALQLLYSFQLLGYLQVERVTGVPARDKKEAFPKRDAVFNELFSVKKEVEREAKQSARLTKPLPNTQQRSDQVSHILVPAADILSAVHGSKRGLPKSVYLAFGSVGFLILTVALIAFSFLHFPTNFEGSTKSRSDEIIVLPANPLPSNTFESPPVVIEQPEGTIAEKEKNSIAASAPLLDQEKKEVIEQKSTKVASVARPLAKTKPVLEPLDKPLVREVEEEVKPKVKPVSELEVYVKRADTQRKSGKLHLALRTYEEIAAKYPNHVQSQLHRAEILFELDRNSEAQLIYEGLLKKDPYNADAYLALGTIYQLEGDSGRALRAYRNYLRVVEPGQAHQLRILEVQRIVKSLESQEIDR